MSDTNGVTQDVSEMSTGDAPAEPKGKGKAVEQAPQDLSMEEEEDSSEEDNSAEDEEVGDADEDDPEEGLDLDEIIGQRTRGKQIDFAQAAEDQGEDLEEDDDDDEDFESEGEDEDAMEE